jgi:hypothetical protein
MKTGDLVKMICELNDFDESYNRVISTEVCVGLYNKIIDLNNNSFFGSKHQVYVDGELKEYSENIWKIEVLNER